MLHKISDFCKKIDGLKEQSDRLYNLKYNHPKTPERDIEIDNMISDIQATCKLIAGCKKFNFKSTRLPSQEVKHSTGMDCAYYSQKIVNSTSEKRT